MIEKVFPALTQMAGLKRFYWHGTKNIRRYPSGLPARFHPAA
jgi:hypothetical protein